MKRIYKGLAVVAASCITLALLPKLARSADHQDGPAVKNEPTADINDLYSWMDGNNAVFALTVYPNAPTGALFSDSVQYVIHTSSAASFGATETAEDIICTFSGTAAPQTTSCWLGASDEVVSGDATGASGLASADGKFKVFAGLRGDPFFFSLDSFKKTVATVQGAEGVLSFNDAGCPTVDGVTSGLLVNSLKTDPNDGGAAFDHFATFQTLAIVVSVDKSLITKGGPIVASWASTHNAQ